MCVCQVQQCFQDGREPQRVVGPRHGRHGSVGCIDDGGGFRSVAGALRKEAGGDGRALGAGAASCDGGTPSGAGRAPPADAAAIHEPSPLPRRAFAVARTGRGASHPACACVRGGRRPAPAPEPAAVADADMEPCRVDASTVEIPAQALEEPGDPRPSPKRARARRGARAGRRTGAGPRVRVQRWPCATRRRTRPRRPGRRPGHSTPRPSRR